MEQQLRHNIVSEEYREASIQGLTATITAIDQQQHSNTSSSNSSAVPDQDSLGDLEAAEVLSQLDDLEAEMMSQLEDSDLEFDDEDFFDNDNFVEVGALHVDSPERDVTSPEDDRKTPVLDIPQPTEETTPTNVSSTFNGHSNCPSNGVSDRWSLVKEERMKRKSLV